MRERAGRGHGGDERAAGRGGERDARDGGDAADRLRIDRWLWCTRFYRSRAQAAEAVAGGRVHVNGARVKPARALKVGDVLLVSQHGREIELTVRAIPRRRGPAPEARACYEESAASVAAGERLSAQHRLAALATPRPDVRPDKKSRRELLDLARRQGRD